MLNVLVSGAGGGVGQGIIKSLNLIDDIAIHFEFGAHWASGISSSFINNVWNVEVWHISLRGLQPRIIKL